MWTNFKDHWKTTLTGIILAISVLLTTIGVFTPEQATEVQTQSGVIFTAITNIIGGISALILIFKAKDS